ncbi:MAG: hypothetical protein WKF40_02340 [Thermoleophilaceae bacterium]
MRAVRQNPDASIVQAAKAVADGRAEALVSAGSTGQTLAAATLSIKRLEGVHRPALAGAGAHPGQAGAAPGLRGQRRGAARAPGAVRLHGRPRSWRPSIGVRRPSVGLLSVGAENGKGTPEVLEARERLAAGTLNFVGNLEGFDLPGAAADVVVADGFTGNIALKVLEGTSRVVRDAMRGAVTSGAVSSVGGLLIRGAVGRLRDSIDPEAVGGAILLGLRKPVVVGHGSFGPRGSPARSGSPAGRSTRTWSIGPRPRWPPGAPCGPHPLVASRP